MTEWNAESLAQRLSGSGKSRSRKKGSSWMAPCPAHDDGKPSLHLTDGHSRLLWHCHAGCSQEDVAKALASIISEGFSTPVKNPKNKKESSDQIDIHFPNNSEISSINIDSFYHFVFGLPSKVWTYTDKNGDAMYYVARYETDNGKEIVPWSWIIKNKSEPSLKMMAWPERRLLYNLKEIADRPDVPVLYVEGEKAADAARSIFPNFVVTTHQGGGNAFEKTDFRPLRDRTVIIQPDNDQPGIKMANGLYGALTGISKKTLLMEWPKKFNNGSIYEMIKGADCADHKESGWNHEMIIEAKRKNHFKLIEPDPTYQFGDGDVGVGWGCVTIEGDRAFIEFRDQKIAECDADDWRKAIPAIEKYLNDKLMFNGYKSGRFSRREGSVHICFYYTGPVYGVLKLLSENGYEVGIAKWMSKNAYGRALDFMNIERSTRQTVFLRK